MKTFTIKRNDGSRYMYVQPTMPRAPFDFESGQGLKNIISNPPVTGQDIFCYYFVLRF